jgi:Holliday junction resolvase RusA-like endonuclease
MDSAGMSIVTIHVDGVEAAPWRAPDIGTGTRRNGTRFRFARARGKSNLAEGRVNLKDWKSIVSEQARKAMEGRQPFRGAVSLSMTFRYRADANHQADTIAFIPLKANKKTGILGKPTLRGRTMPDITNMYKSTEDALHGIVLLDDYQTRVSHARCVFGEQSGVTITVIPLSEEDYISEERGNNETAGAHAGGGVPRKPRTRKPRNRREADRTDEE